MEHGMEQGNGQGPSLTVTWGSTRRAQGASRLPDFCIIGAMRSGTTSLSRYLGHHPGVQVPDVKECHYFDRNHDRGLSWYVEHFSGAAPDQVVGEATPNYLHDPEVPGRMHACMPDVKLIAILRNPVDRAYSHYWHRRARGEETLSFERALEREDARIGSADALSRAHYSYCSRGLYAEQLSRFLAYYPSSSLLVARFEDLRDDPVRVFERVCSFLGVDASVVPDVVGRRLNPHVRFRALGLRGLAKRSPRPVARLLGRVNVARADYPPMSGPTRTRLLRQFEEPNRRLSELVGIDVGSWSR